MRPAKAKMSVIGKDCAIPDDAGSYRLTAKAGENVCKSVSLTAGTAG